MLFAVHFYLKHPVFASILLNSRLHDGKYLQMYLYFQNNLGVFPPNNSTAVTPTHLTSSGATPSSQHHTPSSENRASSLSSEEGSAVANRTFDPRGQEMAISGSPSPNKQQKQGSFPTSPRSERY